MRGHAVANGLPVLAVNRVGLEKDPSGQTEGIQFWGTSSSLVHRARSSMSQPPTKRRASSSTSISSTPRMCVAGGLSCATVASMPMGISSAALSINQLQTQPRDMSNLLRFQVVEEAFKKKAREVPTPSERPSEYFGKYVFNRQKMFKYLRPEVYNKMIDVMDNGARLDRSIADAVAEGMKKWAQDMGVTHYTHWFQPLTEGTAEKHDAFVEHDGKGGMMEAFSGKLLVQQEPDASSFPNGGIRNTFEARGYSAWDPTSPVFIIDDTLCIPTIFIAYTGEALDYKAPLLRSIRAVTKAAKEVCDYFYEDVKKVQVNLGWEQEYFLVDEGLYSARPDLLMTGRTLMGHESAKNQQMDDHYFGTIPDRVQAFMKDLEIQALELAIPCKTRHNEVAPNQFELAPIYEECNLAVDHNMLLMSLMKRVARNHGFRVLLHEKPFDGINGSGKHNNWSLTATQKKGSVLLHAPGKTPEENLRFVTFIVETLMAVYRHNGLLKASIVSATNAHRLGGNEAPGHHQLVPRQTTHRTARPYRTLRQGRALQPEGQARHGDRHPADPRPHHRQYRPQPHLTLRLHG